MLSLFYFIIVGVFLFGDDLKLIAQKILDGVGYLIVAMGIGYRVFKARGWLN